MALPDSPLTRGEQYLAKAAGQETALPNVPLTRIEQYLAKIAGQDVAIPNVPLTHLEQYLAAIAENGGGGNPNSVQRINNETLANPWGSVSYSELAAALGSGNATATLRFQFNGLTAMLPLASNDGTNIYGSSADVQPTLSDSGAAAVDWDSGGDISSARAIMGGQVADMTAYAPGLPSYLEIYWHPMPD